MNRKINFFLIFMCLCAFSLHSQSDLLVQGTVTSVQDGGPIPGVKVNVVGESGGTSTDFDGKYTINVTSGGVLQFSYVGFKTQIVTISQSSIVDIVLLVDGVALESSFLSSIDVNDIQSVAVLKDAASAAIYGSRAGGGVIIAQIHGRLTSEQRDLRGEDDNNAPPMLKIYWQDGKIPVKTKVLKDLNASPIQILHDYAWGNDDGFNFEQEVVF